MRILLLVLGFISSGALAKTIISADYFTYAHYYDLGISYSADREGLNLELQTLGGATESEDFGSIKAGARYNQGKLRSYTLVAGGSSTGERFARSLEATASSWFNNEQYQLAVGMARDWVEQPGKQYLDLDAKLVKLPPYTSNTTYSIENKFLINSTLVTHINYAVTQFTTRPDRHQVELGAKKYVPEIATAIHINIGGAKDSKQVERTTNYGKINAYYVETTVLSERNKPHALGTYYRFYKEDELVRAGNYDKIYGSDTIGLLYLFDNSFKSGIYYYKSNQSIEGYMLQLSLDTE